MEDFGFKLQDINKNELQSKKIIKIVLFFVIFLLLFLISIKIIKSFYKDKIENINNIPLIKSKSKTIKVLPEDTGGLIVDNLNISVYDVIDNKDNKDVNPVINKIKQNVEVPNKISNNILNEQEMLANKINEIQNDSEILINKDEEILQNNQKNKIIVEEIKNNIENKEENKPNIKINKENNKRKTNIEELEKLGNKSLIKNLKNNKDIKPGIKVQLLALKSKNSVIEYWNKLSNKYEQLFKDKNYYIESVNLNDARIIYRLQIGMFKNEELANSFCEEYIKLTNKSKIDCIIIKE